MISGLPMRSFTVLIAALTAAMFAFHLISTRVLGRALQGSKAAGAIALVVRAEAAYYLLLGLFAWATHQRSLAIAVLVLGLIHVLAWLFAEGRWEDLLEQAVLGSSPSANPVSAGQQPHTPRVRLLLRAVQAFDWAEAVVLFWILSTLLRMAFGHRGAA